MTPAQLAHSIATRDRIEAKREEILFRIKYSHFISNPITEEEMKNSREFIEGLADEILPIQIVEVVQ